MTPWEENREDLEMEWFLAATKTEGIIPQHC